jgi:hypothetical protein
VFAPPRTEFEDIAPPSDLTQTPVTAPADEVNVEVSDKTTPPADLPPADSVAPVREHSPRRAFTMEEYDEDAEAAAAASVDDLSAYVPAEGELSPHLRGEVQQAFTLARHGALRMPPT